jgi:hypothetical protein
VVTLEHEHEAVKERLERKEWKNGGCDDGSRIMDIEDYCETRPSP